MAEEDLNKPRREERDFNLRTFLAKYLRYWYVFLLSLVLALAVAKYYNWYKNPVYQVTAKLLVKDENVGKDRFLQQLEVESTPKNIENEIEILRSQSLMAKALSRLDFEVSYFLIGDVKVSEVYKDCPFKIAISQLDYAAYSTPFYIDIIDADRFRCSYETTGGEISREGVFDKPLDTGLGVITLSRRDNFDIVFSESGTDKRHYRVSFNTIGFNQNKYLSKLNVALSRPQSTVLQLYLEDEVPQKALDFVNTLIEVYLENDIDIKNRAAASTAEFLDEQLTSITSDLESIETNRENYKVSKGIVDLESESQMVLEGIKDLDERRALNATRLGLIRELRKYVSENQSFGDLAPAVLDIDDPLLIKLINKLSELQSQREIVLNRSTANDPALIAIHAEIELTRSSLLENIRNIEKGMERKAEEIGEAIDKYEGRIRRIPTTERELLEIERRFRIQESLYVFLLEKRAELSISLAATESDTRVVDGAHVLPGPIAPVPQRAYSIAVLLGLLIPVIGIFIAEKLNDKVTTIADIRKLTKIPLVGVVRFNREPSALVTIEKPRSSIAEEYRNLRTNLSFFHSDDGPDVYMVTSSIGTEGKTFTAMNLAAVLASSGAKTVLVGLDLRKPRIVEDFDIENKIGCSNYLSGNARLDEIISRSEKSDRPDVIPSGPTPPNPAELILSSRMRQLIDELSSRYDKIVIDTPPVGLVSDGFILSEYANVVLFVVREGITRKNHLEHAEELRAKGRLKQAAIVFNAVRAGRGYGYAGGYGYGYRYGYSRDYGNYFDEEPQRGWRARWNRLRGHGQ